VPHAEHPRLLREPGERRNREDDEDRCGPALGPREVLIKWTGVVRNLGNLQAKRRRQLGSPDLRDEVRFSASRSGVYHRVRALRWSRSVRTPSPGARAALTRPRHRP
jgi:hypothetical protein